MENPAWLWHARLGHVNFDTIRRLGTSDLVQGIPLIDQPTQICEACLAGKHTRQSFPSQTSFRAPKPLDQVYADLCGPITPATGAGNRYILLFVDDHSRFKWSYMLKSKDEALDRFKTFKAMVESQYGAKIKVLRTDRGGEFTSKEFNSFCEQAGIIRQLTAPYTPQQNGVVERRNRTVMNTTRSVLNAMKMPQFFWAEAVRHSIYVLNRLPTRTLKNQTPYEALKGRKPRLDHIRVFGCVGHVKTPTHLIKKLDDRSIQMVHLGVEPGTKAYRMYDAERQKIVISRDVIFDEARGWEWSLEADHWRDSKETEFAIQMDGIAAVPAAQNPQNSLSEPNSPVLQATNSSLQNDGSTGYCSGQQSTPQRTPGSPETTVKSRGPMLPRMETDTVNLSDPSLAEDETYDDTPPQGWRKLNEVYDLLLVEIQELLFTEEEPKNFKDAVGHEEWELAMEDEIASIKRNNTWELTELPPGHRAIGLKWVYIN